MAVGIYIRVSTEEQAKEGYSISAQREKLKAYCEIQDWKDYRFYVDEGISAKNLNRPQLQLMLKHIQEGIIDTVLVYRLDRLTRSVKDLYKLLELFEKHGCKFKSATEVYDTGTAMGRMFITIVAAMAQWERENLGERLRVGFQEKARQGKYAANKRPFGYNLDPKTGKLTINEEEAQVFRTIVDLYLKKGYGANRICKWLNERGIKTRDGNTWNDKPLIQMLKNPLYAGTIRWGLNHDQPTIVENAAPAIIDKKTFDEIQRTIERRRGQHPRNVGNDYIFSALMRCPECGSSMGGHKVYFKSPVKGKVVYKNYRCIWKNTGQCKKGKDISEKKVEKAFLDYIETIDFSSDIEKATADVELLKKKNEAEELKKELDKIEARKKKWQYAWANEMMTDDEFRQRMNEEREREEKIKAQLDEIGESTEEEVTKEELAEALRDIRKNWEQLADEEKKSLVQMVVKRMHIEFEGDDVRIKDIEFY
ncbi:recombinase family protein [Geobacillus icigianus]|uniref:Integrase n=1 Tax=Geobacillus subterraneus TaxID=129338 RepID=A0A679FLM6_9BACL|nr:recombinase family protein [Geobacillus subterraneus]BBW97268.1 integrase [Geobacillus subterraneus]